MSLPPGRIEAADEGTRDIPPFVPSIDTRDIFRQMIADEIRSGRLSRGRRRRIVRYATSMGVSAVEAGKLIAACRDQLLDSDEPEHRYHALRLIDPPPSRAPSAVRLALILAAALAADALVVWLLL